MFFNYNFCAQKPGFLEKPGFLINTFAKIKNALICRLGGTQTEPNKYVGFHWVPPDLRENGEGIVNKARSGPANFSRGQRGPVDGL